VLKQVSAAPLTHTLALTLPPNKSRYRHLNGSPELWPLPHLPPTHHSTYFSPNHPIGSAPPPPRYRIILLSPPIFYPTTARIIVCMHPFHLYYAYIHAQYSCIPQPCTISNHTSGGLSAKSFYFQPPPPGMVLESRTR